MLIRLEDIKENGLFLELSEPPDEFPDLQALAESTATDFLGPIQVRARAVRVREMVEVEGTVESRLRLSCSRCLREFETAVSTSFAVTFTRSLDAPEEEMEEVELTAEEMGLLPFHGEEIDLREVIQEQVIMGMPLRSLCDEGCRGLCPQCGKDLNQGDCGCAPTDPFGRFAKLKDLKVDSKKPGKK